MKALGKTVIETVDEADQLLFRVTTKAGWLEFVLPLAIFAVFFAFMWSTHRILAVSGFIAALIFWISYFAQPASGSLLVTGQQLRADGNLHRSFTTNLVILADEIKQLYYSDGSEDQAYGLYVVSGTQHFCLLAYLNREETESIIRRIRQRFPDLEQGDRNPNSLFFSSDGAITRLNLNS